MEAYGFFFDSEGNLFSDFAGLELTPADLPKCYYWTA